MAKNMGRPIVSVKGLYAENGPPALHRLPQQFLRVGGSSARAAAAGAGARRKWVDRNETEFLRGCKSSACKRLHVLSALSEYTLSDLTNLVARQVLQVRGLAPNAPLSVPRSEASLAAATVTRE
jgi:hypothetical protein